MMPCRCFRNRLTLSQFPAEFIGTELVPHSAAPT